MTPATSAFDAALREHVPVRHGSSLSSVVDGRPNALVRINRERSEGIWGVPGACLGAHGARSSACIIVLQICLH